jgi:hypothetical protein
MPANKHHRHAIKRMLREVDSNLDDDDIIDVEDRYTQDIAPDEPGDGRIVRKHIEDENSESLWNE